MSLWHFKTEITFEASIPSRKRTREGIFQLLFFALFSKSKNYYETSVVKRDYLKSKLNAKIREQFHLNKNVFLKYFIGTGDS